MIRKTKKSGQALVEYALVLAIIVVTAIIVVEQVGDKTAGTSDNVQSQMTARGVAFDRLMTAGF